MLAVRKTCQCCGRLIGAKAGLIAHHGYHRPRDWHVQTASCMGARRLPFEVARDALGDLLEMLRAHVNRLEAAIDDMRAAPKAVMVRPARLGRPAVFCEVSDRLYPVRQREWFACMESEVRAIKAELAQQQKRYDEWRPETPAEEAA